MGAESIVAMTVAFAIGYLWARSISSRSKTKKTILERKIDAIINHLGFKFDLSEILTLSVALLCLLFVGPELGLGIEVLGVLELFGVELFVLSFVAPLIFYGFKIESWVTRIDPYFFVPSSKQVIENPGIVGHAIPGYVVLTFWVASISFLAT